MTTEDWPIVEVEQIEVKGLDTRALLQGDVLDVLRMIPDDSIDAVVTDPPYGLSKEPDMAEVLTHWMAGGDFEHTGSGFMGKTWDSFVPGPSVWREVLRVLRPGGHLLCFAGSRTQDLMGISIRLAGFEIRDTLCWMYGSGFPKSLNVSKAIDKAEAKQWEGWGTALKPAHEPIIMARKPLSVDGRKATVAANVLEHGTGGINIDATRIGYQDEADSASATPQGSVTAKSGALAGGTQNDNERTEFERPEQKGRFPANVLFSHHEDCVRVGVKKVRSDGHHPKARPGTTTITTDGHQGQDHLVERHSDGELVEDWQCESDCPVRLLDEQTGTLRASGVYGGDGSRRSDDDGVTGFKQSGDSEDARRPTVMYADKGGASRFFYNAKTSKSERSAGLPGTMKNSHPTVKPVEVMRWLVRLVTPPNGVVLDPFCGSGTTLVAAAWEGRGYIGSDKDTEGEYLPVAHHRRLHAEKSALDLGVRCPEQTED